MLQTLAELRQQSHLFRQPAEKETTLEVKRRLASHALALAQLAEKIEREASDCTASRGPSAPM